MIPIVSVLLPVYNGERYLAESINSVLSQTLVDLELIIIDDGSSDGSWEIITGYTDARLKVIKQQNRGLARTLNRAIQMSRGAFLARQDQDDVSLPERLAHQVEYMENHPNVGLLGGWADIFDEDILSTRVLKHPVHKGAIVYAMLFDNAFVHSTVMIRKSILKKTGRYSEALSKDPPEDYELWSRMMRYTDVANLPEIVLHYRETAGSMSRQPNASFMNRVMAISADNIAWISDETVPKNDSRDFASVYHNKEGYRPQHEMDWYENLITGLARRAEKKYAVHPHSMNTQQKEILENIRRRLGITKKSSFLQRCIALFR